MYCGWVDADEIDGLPQEKACLLCLKTWLSPLEQYYCLCFTNLQYFHISFQNGCIFINTILCWNHKICYFFNILSIIFSSLRQLHYSLSRFCHFLLKLGMGLLWYHYYYEQLFINQVVICRHSSSYFPYEYSVFLCSLRTSRGGLMPLKKLEITWESMC